MAVQNRRPLTSRDRAWAVGTAAWLAKKQITPNQISIAAMVFAAIGAAAFWLVGQGHLPRAFWAAGALFCQLRLLCNLFDGMVAIESGRAAPDGPFWNEFPDRISDGLLLVALGYALDLPSLGWSAAAFAFLTAYVRELGANCGQGADFSGPMAKQHRMALLTIAAVVSSFEALWGGSGTLMIVALWGVALGSAFTALRRAMRLRAKLLASKT